jgi:putative methionine-R-sulfoxide reductase with GAF domain
MAATLRDYSTVIESLVPAGSRDDRMTAVVDALWRAFGNHQPISWVGFYLDQPDQPEEMRLVLGPHRDKPACSPIGLHGVCGQALTEREVKIIRDVNELGEHYIACDPRDRSEIVLPLFDGAGICWGVLDDDSWEVGALSDDDARGLRAVLLTAGLTEEA